jgi:O-antigen/teichoic acid export membrane protein
MTLPTTRVLRRFRLRHARTASRDRSAFSLVVAKTTMFNIAATLTAGVAGIIVSRSLGPAVRGEYAGIVAWFNVALIVGALGQSAATTYFVARDSRLAPDYLATSRNLMAASGAVVLTVGLLAAPLLAQGDGTVAWGYRLMFLTCLASFVGITYTAGLQACDIFAWNLVRISQPALFLAMAIVLHVAGRLGLTTALVALSITIIAQATLSYLLCRKQRMTGGRATSTLVRPVTRYGISHAAGSMPTLITGWLDQLVLSFTVAPAALGHYAVAASLTTLTVPLVSAVGHVAFPRLASQALSRASTERLQRWAILSSAGAGVALMLPLAASATWLLPAVFGTAFRDAVPLVWLLAPNGVFVACGQVCGDLLRGHGRPLAVARAQGAAAVVAILLMSALLPALGVAGAAIASSTAAGVALLLMIRTLRDLSRETGAEAAPKEQLISPAVAHELP